VIRDSAAEGVEVTPDSSVDLVSCLIVRSADRGIYAWDDYRGSTITLTNCVIDGNQGGGLQINHDPMYPSSISMTNTLVTNNLNFGVQIHDGVIANLAYNDVYNPGAADYDIIPSQTGLNHNISQDPLYASPSTLNYRVQAGSPAIDSGTSDNAPAADLQDALRIDDPATANTGGGEFAYYDRGAYEFGGLPPSQMNLATSNVSGPAVGVQDGTISVTWKVTNIGPDAAVGSWYDAIYLSRDTAWSRDDALIGSRVHTGGLEASGGFYDAQADVPIHSVAPGTYYYLVKADARYETAEAPDVRANNVAPSSTTVDFPMAQLVLGTPWPDTFTQAGQDKCYRLNVPSGGNLRVSLDDADNLGVNELYVRLGTPPVPGSGGAHAYSSVGSADHAILIRGAPAGDWYVLAANVSGPGDYTLAADVSTLQLSRVTPASLGDAAPMTLTLQGVGFLPGSSVSLVAAGGGSYAAPTVSVDSFT
jgi:hypothetical protein